MVSRSIRIAIVNDMPSAIEAIRLVLATVPTYKIAWVAYDGVEAVTKCAIDRPDLILMDLVMPVMDGVEAIQQIMAHSPCPIVVVTASIQAQIPKVFEAMGYGALDAVNTPMINPHQQSDSSAKMLQKIATIAKLLGKSTQRKSQSLPKVKRCPIRQSIPPLIAIGASTGGPHALAAILSHLPKNFAAATVIIQHIDAQFAPGLVEWLNGLSPLKVELAMERSRLEPGTVLVAGTNDHLVLSSELTLRYTPKPREHLYRPSVDVFFKSIVEYWPGKGVGVLLTGMGKDGAKGLKLLRSAGWNTIAQDSASCVVYGMPKAAVELEAAEQVLPIEAIASTLVNLLA